MAYLSSGIVKVVLRRSSDLTRTSGQGEAERMKGPKQLLQVASAATLALLVALPGWAAAPAGYTALDIGDVGEPGTIEVGADGLWTVAGSGDMQDTTDQDAIFFVHKSLTGDGTIIARTVQQLRDGGTVKSGIVIRANDSPGSPYAGLVMPTSSLAWQYRAEQDGAAARVSSVGGSTFPQWTRLQRVGNTISGFLSDDGKLWRAHPSATRTIPLEQSALFGVMVSSRSPGTLTTVEFDNVQVLEGVVSVYGTESAATDKLVLLSWQPLAKATGYNVYRGAKDASLDKMTLVATQAPADSFYLDDKAADTPLRDMSYVVAPVFTGADGKPFEGPAVRVR
jgi:hypothetical protein